MFRCLLNNATRFGLLSLTAIAFLSNGGHAEEKDSAPKTLVPIEQVKGPLSEDFVVAEIEGTTLLLGEFFESIGLAIQMDEIREKTPSSKFRELQEKRLKLELRFFLEQRLLVRRFLEDLTVEESNRLTEGLATVWREQVENMIQRINQESGKELANTEELQNYLREHRQTPLEVLRKQFEDRIMAGECLRRNVTIKDKLKREQATKAFIEYVYANADVRTCLDGTTD